MQAAIDQEGLREAKARFGLEGVEGLLPLKSSEDESEDESECEGFGSRVLGGKPSTLGEITAPYTCAEHKEVDWACRFCLAAAILNGPVVPEMVIQADDDASYKTDQLKGVLAGQYGDPDRIRVLVCAARWDHTVVRKW